MRAPFEDKTPGETLRSLRKQRKVAAIDVAAQADISPTTLSHLENDHVESPERKTLEKILDTLDMVKPLTALDRKAVLEPFGYRDEDSLPSVEDIRRAKRLWAESFRDEPYPSYLVDYAQRMHDFNPLILKFIGASGKEAFPPDLTMFDFGFNPLFRGPLKVLNEREFIYEFVLVMKSEFQPFLQTEWCQSCLGEAFRKYWEFKAIWDSVPDSELREMGVRSMGPLILSDSQGNVLKFQVEGIDMVIDPRFRAVQYKPLDKETALMCFTLFQG